ncbi:conserved hypothetical protein [Trichinella spiralis]|uniref:hypothetical protein n=1 Tax=Trichinella spiralis TaxID=6334 RepID=UPI0001EFC78C|nr:conserved hypothetical protein [Trichinella spiralis]
MSHPELVKSVESTATNSKTRHDIHEGRVYNLKHTNMQDKQWVCRQRRAAEEMKTVPQIYHEEASSASADLETAGQFPTYKSVKTAMYRKRAQKFPRLPPTRQ